MKKIAIISPSGKFYGSEQVLFDFLQTTSMTYHVYVPNGLFNRKLINTNGRHIIHTFVSVKLLYLELFFHLFRGNYDGIYINEAGHSKYLYLFSKIFPNKRFFVHIRLVEDTKADRLINYRKNITYISVSNYITQMVRCNTGINCHTIHDLYVRSRYSNCNLRNDDHTLRAHIVGRVTETKGLVDIIKFCRYVESIDNDFCLELHFFGNVNNESVVVSNFILDSKSFKNIKCIFHGFVDSKDEIYKEGAFLLHFNKVESLGRIYFEAIDSGIPFVGFNKGGIGEIAKILGLEDFLVNADNTDWEYEMYEKIKGLRNQWTEKVFRSAVAKLENNFSPIKYTKQLETLFNE